MNQLESLPTSIRERLELARTLQSNGDQRSADSVLQQAVVELARTQPEMCALLLSANLGYQGISATVVERTTVMIPRPITFCGFNVGEEWVALTTTKETTKHLRLTR